MHHFSLCSQKPKEQLNPDCQTIIVITEKISQADLRRSLKTANYFGL